MGLHKLLEKEAFKFIKGNAIFKHGDIVSTLWGEWKTSHDVMISKIGCELFCGYENGTPIADFRMVYIACRIDKDGKSTERHDGGIVLTNITTSEVDRSGKRSFKFWKKPGGTDFNHRALCWFSKPL